MTKGLLIKRCLYTLAIALMVPVTLSGQEDVTIKKKEFKTGVEIGFKEAWKAVKEGDKHFREGKGTYGQARDLYLFANQYNPDNAHLNYKIGACYLFTDDKYVAIDYLLRSYDLGASSYIKKPVSFDKLVTAIKLLGKYWFEVVELAPEEGENPSHGR